MSANGPPRLNRNRLNHSHLSISVDSNDGTDAGSSNPNTQHLQHPNKFSRIGLLPCLFVLILWFILPQPRFDHSPAMDPQTKSAVLKAMAASSRTRRFSIHASSAIALDNTKVDGSDVSVSNPPDQDSIALEVAPKTNNDTQNHQTTASAPVIASHLKLFSKHQSVLVISAISPTPCKSARGDHLNLLALKNKQDYCRYQGYDFYLSNRQSDKRLNGAWNKVALIRDLLQQTSAYDWLVWMDYDSLVMDQRFSIPFEKYKDYDFVLWGQPKELYEIGDAHMGLNTGVFFVRNTEWTRKMFASVAELGTGNGKDSEELMKSILGNYDWALYDQNGFAYWLKMNADQYQSRVYLESSYDINAYWKDMPMHKLRQRDESAQRGEGLVEGGEMFIKHFMGCQFCSGINTAESEQCNTDFMESWNYANQIVEDILHETRQESNEKFDS